MARKQRRNDNQREQFQKLLEQVGQGFLWGRETGNAEAMAFSSGVLMGGLIMIHPDWSKERLTEEHQAILTDLEQRYDEHIAQGGITFIYPLDDE